MTTLTKKPAKIVSKLLGIHKINLNENTQNSLGDFDKKQSNGDGTIMQDVTQNQISLTKNTVVKKNETVQVSKWTDKFKSYQIPRSTRKRLIHSQSFEKGGNSSSQAEFMKQNGSLEKINDPYGLNEDITQVISTFKKKEDEVGDSRNPPQLPSSSLNLQKHTSQLSSKGSIAEADFQVQIREVTSQLQTKLKLDKRDNQVSVFRKKKGSLRVTASGSATSLGNQAAVSQNLGKNVKKNLYNDVSRRSQATVERFVQKQAKKPGMGADNNAYESVGSN